MTCPWRESPLKCPVITFLPPITRASGSSGMTESHRAKPTALPNRAAAPRRARQELSWWAAIGPVAETLVLRGKPASVSECHQQGDSPEFSDRRLSSSCQRLPHPSCRWRPLNKGSNASSATCTAVSKTYLLACMRSQLGNILQLLDWGRGGHFHWNDQRFICQ